MHGTAIASAAPASAGFVHQSSGRSSAPGHLIATENAKPANAYMLGAGGILSEGVRLELNHPLIRGGTPALFVERTYLLRDFKSEDRRPLGCLYEVKHEKAKTFGLVRRLHIEEVKLHDDLNARPLRLLRRLDGEAACAYVHVITTLLPGVELVFAPLWSGVQSGTVMVQGMTENLVVLKKDEEVHAFYSDGHVVQISYDGSRCTASRLGANEALNARLARVKDVFGRASVLENSNSAYGANEAYGLRLNAFSELAGMLQLTKVFPGFRKEISSTVGSGVKQSGGRLPSEVYGKFFRSVRAIGAVPSAFWWMPTDSGDDEVVITRKNELTQTQLRKLVGRQHMMITDAIEGRMTWEALANILRFRSEEGVLGNSAKKRFCVNCPPNSGLSSDVGKFPVVFLEGDEKGPSPLGRREASEEKAEAARRRHKVNLERRAENNRNARKNTGSSKKDKDQGKKN